MATDQERLIVQLEARIDQFEKNLAKANQTARREFGSIEARARQSARTMENSFSNLAVGLNRQLMAVGRNALGVLGAGMSISSVAKASQEYVALSNTLKVVGLEGKELEQTMGALFQVAQRHGTAIAPLSTLYARVSAAQKELNVSSADVLRFTDGISLALRVAGTDSKQASGALLQLSQAIGGSVVRAEEFNSIMEGARPILTAVAAGMKEAGGSVSTLRNLVNDGKVSSEAFFRAFLAGMPMLEAQAAKASGTVGQSVERIKNAFTFLVGELDKTSGASDHAAKNLLSVSDVISRMPQYIRASVEGMQSLRGWLNNVASHPFWIRLARATGATFTEEEARGMGLTVVNPQTPAQRVAGGHDALRPPAPAPAPQPKVNPISLKDYAVKGKDKDGGAESQDSFERMTASIEKRIALLQVEAATIDQGAAARDRARVIVELETAARKANEAAGLKNTEVTAAQREKIESLADSYAKAREKLEALNSPLMQFARESAKIGENLQRTTVTALENMGDEMADVIMNTKSIGDAFKSMADSVIRDLLRIAIRQNITGPLAGALGGLLGGGGGAGAPMRLLPGLYHTGGVVGFDSRPGKNVSPIMFDRAPRFERGGIAGLGPDEVPIIAHRNEEIIRRDDPRHRFNGGGADAAPIVNVNVQNNAAGVDVQAQQAPDGSLEILVTQAVDKRLGSQMARGRGSLAKAAGARARNAHLRG